MVHKWLKCGASDVVAPQHCNTNGKRIRPQCQHSDSVLTHDNTTPHTTTYKYNNKIRNMDWHAPTDMQRQVANMNWGCNINESWKDAAPARGNSYAYKPRLEQLILRPAQMDERINCNYGCQTTIKARLRKSKRVCEQILKQRTRRQIFCSTCINFDPKWNTN